MNDPRDREPRLLRGHYQLDDLGEPILATSLIEWARWFGDIANRRLALTEVQPGLEVSTVFLGLDHNFSLMGDPLLWKP